MAEIFSHREIIYTIYQEKSFSRAAQKLFIAQPSLSLLVKRLEQQLGVPLFDRSCKPIRLTEAGYEYIRAVEDIRKTESEFKNYLQSVSNLEAGSLNIGSNQLLSSLLLPGLIADFTRAHPNIRLSLTDANSTTLHNDLFMGELDIIIDNYTMPADFFDQEKISTECLLLAVPASFAENEALLPYRLSYSDILAGRHIDKHEPVPLKGFENIPFLLMNRDNDTRKVTDAIFQEAHFSPNVLFELDRLTTLYSYIELGVAASIVSDTLVQHIYTAAPDNVVYFPLNQKYACRSIFASYKKNKYQTPAMRAFVERLANLK